MSMSRVRRQGASGEIPAEDVIALLIGLRGQGLSANRRYQPTPGRLMVCSLPAATTSPPRLPNQASRVLDLHLGGLWSH